MNSRRTERFRELFNGLPIDVQRQAHEAYGLFEQNPHHPGLRFKRVHLKLPIYSVRIGIHWRAMGVREGETIIWFWIGSHGEYDGILARL